MTVLWSPRLPDTFKRYCAKMSIETCSIQYESDELMRKKFGDDYGIACCVSAMRIGKQMQFFGARANLAKALLYAINGGRDEKSGVQVGPELFACQGEISGLRRRDEKVRLSSCDWLAGLYVNTLNVIHYMHDKYCYEKIQMALHDNEILRTMACGVAGLSVVADSLSAIKYAKVRPIRDEDAAWPSILRWRAITHNSATTTPVWMTSRWMWSSCFMTQAAEVPHLPRIQAYHVHPDHHLQCGVRQKDRLHSRRPQGRASPSPPAPIPCTAGTKTAALPP